MDVVIQAALAFGAVAALDFVWAKYTYAMTARQPWLAGTYAGAIFALGGVAAISYVANPWMLIPSVAGAFVGTWVAVRSAGRPLREPLP